MPENWKKYKLKELTTKIGSGATPRGGKGAYKESGISLIRSQNVLDFSFSSDGLAFINDDQAAALKNVTLESQDVLLNITGDSVARLCKVPDQWLPARVNQHVAIVRANEKILSPNFLLYSLLSNENKNLLLTMAGAGATRNALTKTMIEEFEISIPGIKEQKSIASILSALDDKIELNLQMNKTLEEMAMALYKHWFVDFGPFQDGEFVGSELGEIPKGWEVRKFGKLISNKRKNVPAKEIRKEDRYIGLEHIDKGSLSLFSNGFGSKISSNKTAFSKGDILFGKLRPYFKKIGIAPFDGICSTDILVIEPKKNYDYGFALFTIFNDDFIRYTTTVSGGTRMPRVNWNNIEDYKVTVPKSPELIQKFDIIVRNYISQILFNVFENQTLTQLRDTLLPKLISGEVRIKDVEKTLSEVL